MAKSNKMRASTIVNDVKLPVEIKAAIDGLLRPYDLDLDDLLTPKITTPTQMDGKRMLSIRDSETYTGLSRYSLRRAVLKSELSICKVNPSRTGKVLIERAELDRWLNSKKQIQGANQI